MMNIFCKPEAGLIFEVNVIYVKSQGSATWSDLTGKIRVSTISWCTRDWEHGESKGAPQASHRLLCLITPTFWVTLSSKVNPTLRKPRMLIRLNVSVPYFSTIGVTAASPLSLFPRNAVSYPYLDSWSLYRHQPPSAIPQQTLVGVKSLHWRHALSNYVWSYLITVTQVHEKIFSCTWVTIHSNIPCPKMRKANSWNEIWVWNPLLSSRCSYVPC